jgi:hypothetical protein
MGRGRRPASRGPHPALMPACGCLEGCVRARPLPIVGSSESHIPPLGGRFDVFQMGEKAGNSPRERLLGDVLGVDGRFGKEPEEWHL